ncbi:MAG: site-specific DNA-methyltransferase, partial [Thermoanaerobaculia bacterium]|nr:site-specific DNA-methyltransferase [Thermoanaerobaculia bacterium]
PIVMDFFAGSGTTAQGVWMQNARDGVERRFVLVQLPAPLDVAGDEGSAGAALCDELRRPRVLSELTKERLRRAGKSIRNESPIFSGDLGFRVFKLDSTNIRPWDPDRENLERTLDEAVEHIKPERSEADVLFELLLKLGLDLTVPIEKRGIAGKEVHSIGAGALIACLAKEIGAADVEPLALGIVGWQASERPAGESTIVFRDSAFADDVAKTNLTAILEQHGLGNVRSL